MKKFPIEIINTIFNFLYNNRRVKMDSNNKNYLVIFSSFTDYHLISDLYKSIKLYSNKKYIKINTDNIYWFEISNGKKWSKRFISKIDVNNSEFIYDKFELYK